MLSAYLVVDILVVRASGVRVKPFRVATSFIILLAILSTASFTPFAAAAIALTCVWLRGHLPNRMRRKVAIFVVVLAIGLIGVGLVSLSGTSNILGIHISISGVGTELSGRIDHVKVGREEYDLNPCGGITCTVWGHGYRDYKTS